MPTPPGQPVFQVRVTFADIQPPIWRSLLVPGSVRLDKLHLMMQAAFGWENCHLHDFTIGDGRYGTHIDDDYPEDELDERSVTVVQALEGVNRFSYLYDFGDSWEHEVAVEDFRRTPLGLKFGICIDGQNSCPPEDVGGPPGDARFLEALADPEDEERESFLTWVGGSSTPGSSTWPWPTPGSRRFADIWQPRRTPLSVRQAVQIRLALGNESDQRDPPRNRHSERTLGQSRDRSIWSILPLMATRYSGR